MALTMMLSDLANVIYINSFFLPQSFGREQFAAVMMRMGYNLAHINMTAVDEMRQVFLQTFSTVFYGFLIFHTLVYIFLARGSRYALRYTKGYALTAVILVPFEVFRLMGLHLGWMMMTLVTGLSYLFVFLYLRFLAKNQS